MLRRHHGRPGTQIIPTGWDEGHRPSVEGTHRGLISLRKPGGTTIWDPVREENVTVPHRPYAAAEPCRVVAVRATVVEAAEDAVTVAGYEISMAAHLAPEAGDLGALSNTDDPLLDGRDVLITEVLLGTERFERVVLATLND